MFRLIKLIFMILLINDKIFNGLSDELPTTNLPINSTGIDTDFLSDIFNSNVSPDCPGICIHVIVTLLCDDLLENKSCSSGFYRCCAVFNNTNYVNTLVETSPPLEDITTLNPIESSSFEKHISSQSTNVHSLESNQLPNSTTISSPKNKSTTNLYSTSSFSTTPLSVSFSTTQSPSTVFTTNIVKKFTLKCTGACMESSLSKYCGNILTNNDACDDNQICCLQPNKTVFTTTTLNTSSSESGITESIDLNSSSSSIVSEIPETSTALSSSIVSNSLTSTTPNPTTKNQTNSSEKKIVLEEETYKNDTSDNENNTALIKQLNNKNSDNPQDLPVCTTDCVTLLFSLLCDDIDKNKYCSNGNLCCIYNNSSSSDTIETPQPTKPSNQNEIGPCLGTCIPRIISGICSKHSRTIQKTTTCMTGLVCCVSEADSNDEQSINSSNVNKPSLLDNSSDDLSFIEPSESTLNNLNSKFKPPGSNYYQLVPRPNQLMPPSNQFPNLQTPTTPTNLIPPSSNWPFLTNNNNLQKIPIYKPLLSNSQMIPNPYLSNARPNYAQVLNNFNNRSPSVFYPPTNVATTNDLFNNLNTHLTNGHLSNSVLPTMPSPFKLNSTSNLIGHLLSINNISPVSCTGSCIPPLFKFTCFGTNMIYTNFVCSKPGHLCCASVNNVETYESTILGNLNNETSLINSLVHNNYFANNFNLANLVPKGNLPISSLSNLPSNSLSNGNLAPNLQTVSNNNLVNINSAMQNAMKNQVNKNKNSVNKNNNNQNYNLNKMQPIDRINSESTPLIEKITDPSLSSSGNLNRNRHPSTALINKNGPKLTGISNNKWSNSLTSPTNGGSHFTPSEKPLNQKLNTDKLKKPSLIPSISNENYPEVSSKLPVCGLIGESPSSKWCWLVALVDKDNQFISTGALIGTSWVLTSAHSISKLVQDAETIFVRVDESESNASNQDGQIYKVSTAYIHHNHNANTLENDIALLKLQRPIQLNSNVCLICLPARGSIIQPGKKCTVTGYDTETSLRTKEATISILSDYQCLRRTNLLTNKSFVLPTSSFCGEESNSDAVACQFDGPLACFDEEGYYEFTGLVSYGFGCDRKMTGIYGMVKISLFINWINQIISVNN